MKKIMTDEQSSSLAKSIEVLRQHSLASAAEWSAEAALFIPLRASLRIEAKEDVDLDAQVHEFLHSQKKVMALLGDSGAGKSFYTQGLVLKRWENYKPGDPLPVWISLPSLQDPLHHALDGYFASLGFSEEQILALKKTQSFVVVLDAYDETRCTKNILVGNQFHEWDAKVIITCRREYLYHEENYAKRFFMPFHGDKAQPLLYSSSIFSRNNRRPRAYVTGYGHGGFHPPPAIAGR